MSTHKFAVGQAVRFSPDPDQERTARGSFEVVRLLPEAANVFQYRVKSQIAGHERVVREDQLPYSEGRARCQVFPSKVTRPSSSDGDDHRSELPKPLFRGAAIETICVAVAD